MSSESKNYNTRVLLIVGAGASGMLAAVSARRTARALGVSDSRFRIVLLERNDRPGAKIAISGGGHCNITHDGDVRTLLEKGFLNRKEQRFVRHTIHRFTNTWLLELFGAYGMKFTTREDGRVFPVSGRAGDVLDVMRHMLDDASVTLVTGFRADRLDCSGSRCMVHADTGQYEGDAVILATGGASWGSSGTTGDGIRLASAAGHKVVPVTPALAPVWFAVPLHADLVGITLQDILLIADTDGGTSDSRRGNVLISHRGVSGPACLSLSRSVAVMHASGKGPVRMWADFFPGHDQSEISSFILDQAGRHGSRLLRTFLERCPIAPEHLTASGNAVVQTIPNAFAGEILRQAGIEATVTMSALTRQQRHRLVSVLKRLSLGTVRKVPLDRAEVSAGGVSLDDIDPKTMQSRVQPRLYCCGELLDYAGEVGGFNLQAAFSTGWTAGLHVVEALFDQEQ